jgi:hypothetical protein
MSFCVDMQQRAMNIKCRGCYPGAGTRADCCSAAWFVAHLRNRHSVRIRRTRNGDWCCDECAAVCSNERVLEQHLTGAHALDMGEVEPTDECQAFRVDYEPPAWMGTGEFAERASFIRRKLAEISHSKMFVLWASPVITSTRALREDRPAFVLQQALIRLDPDLVLLILDDALDGTFYRRRLNCLTPK